MYSNTDYTICSLNQEPNDMSNPKKSYKIIIIKFYHTTPK